MTQQLFNDYTREQVIKLKRYQIEDLLTTSDIAREQGKVIGFNDALLSLKLITPAEHWENFKILDNIFRKQFKPKDAINNLNTEYGLRNYT